MLFTSFQTLMPLWTEDDGSQLENPMEIPKELWMMVDYLYRNAVQQVGDGYAVRPDRSQAALRASISPNESGIRSVYSREHVESCSSHRE